MPNQTEHPPSARWRFSPCCAAAYDQASAAFARFRDEGDDAPDLDAAAVAEALAHGSVTPALATSVLAPHDPHDHSDHGGPGDSDHAGHGHDHLHAHDDEPDPAEVTALGAFGTWVEREQPVAGLAPARLLVAVTAERNGDVLAAEAALRTAVAAAPDYVPAAAELARYEIDRSELEAAIALLRHPQLAHDKSLLNVVEALRREVESPYAGVGRNDPCPCRSGRKHKSCCLGNHHVLPGQLPSLLLHKLGLFVRRDERHALLHTLADTAVAQLGDSPLANADRLAHDPLVIDFATFEGGAAADYLAARGGLLPPAEHELLEQVVKVPRRLWQVIDVGAGSAVGLSDPAAGGIVYVPARAGMEKLTAESRVLAHVVRVADGDEIIGMAVEVPTELVDDTAELVATNPTADDLAAWYGRRLALLQP
jgi:hypothetical protein